MKNNKSSHSKWLKDNNNVVKAPKVIIKAKPISGLLHKRKGQMLIMNIMMAFLAVIFLVALIPGFRTIITDGLSNASGLNCEGSADYNATLGEISAVGCIGIDLIIPMIVLGTLMAIVAMIFYGRGGQAPSPY